MHQEKVKEINDSELKFCAKITGGGAGFIPHYLNFGGGSRTVLDIQVPYSTRATNKILPELNSKYCSEEVALGFAAASKKLTQELHPECKRPFGIGVTCSLAYVGQREGRENKAFIAIDGDRFTSMIELDFLVDQDHPNLCRMNQEDLVTATILDELYNNFSAKDWITSIGNQNPESVKTHLYTAAPYRDPTHNLRDVREAIIFSGSFNPIHKGHEKMGEIAKQVAYEKSGSLLPLIHEVSCVNFSKPTLDAITMQKRLTQDGVVPDLAVPSYIPRFVDKRDFYDKELENYYMVMGYDTFMRLDQDEIKSLCREDSKAKFLVFGLCPTRLPDDERFIKDERLSNFKSEIRSTDIRKQNK